MRPMPVWPMVSCLDGRHEPFSLETHPDGCPSCADRYWQARARLLEQPVEEKTRGVRFRREKERLIAAGAPLGIVDAFEAAVRAMECEVVAGMIRRVADDAAGPWSLSVVDPADLRLVAGEIERFR